MKKLQFADLKVGQKVFVKYDRSGATWCDEVDAINIDGIETVCQDEKGLHTVDKNGAPLHDLDHYLEVEAIEIFEVK